MPVQLPRVAALVVGALLMAVPAHADALKDEIAPTGKLRVAIAISAAGGAFWSTKTESGGYAGVPVDLGKAMAAQLGVSVEYVAYQNSGQITDAASKGAWDVTFVPKDPEREKEMAFGPVDDVTDATYIVKAGSTATSFATLDQPGGRRILVDQDRNGRVCRRAGRSRQGDGRPARCPRRIRRISELRADHGRGFDGCLGRHLPAEGSGA